MDEITRALQELRRRRAGYQLYSNYYEGNHRLTFATEKFRNTFGNLFREFADNLCPAVVDAVSDRLKLIGFDVEDGPAGAADVAWELWQVNRMDERMGEIHTEALIAGDGYAIVWPDPRTGQPTIYPQDGTSMTVRYDPEVPGHILSAVKAWQTEDEFVRVTLYFPDRIEKWITRSACPAGWPESSQAFVPYEVPGEAWPLQHDYGRVPVFHFANNSRMGRSGKSELKDVVPLQDCLNKSLCDLMVAREFLALPQRYATGLQFDIDPETGKPIPLFVPGADRVWATQSKDVTFGQFEAADLGQFIQEQDSFRAEIARVSRTPLHYLLPQSGEFPSGEALKTAESPFLAKVMKRQTAFGNVWEDLIGFALQMVGQSGVRLSALWEDPAPRSEKDQGEVLLIKKQIGVDDETLLGELGYAPEQIRVMLAKKQATAAEAQRTMLRTFDRGGSDPDEEVA